MFKSNGNHIYRLNREIKMNELYIIWNLITLNKDKVKRFKQKKFDLETELILAKLKNAK